jgi:hypothetical protein
VDNEKKSRGASLASGRSRASSSPGSMTKPRVRVAPPRAPQPPPTPYIGRLPTPDFSDEEDCGKFCDCCRKADPRASKIRAQCKVSWLWAAERGANRYSECSSSSYLGVGRSGA